jgi:hypothetical protein
MVAVFYLVGSRVFPNNVASSVSSVTKEDSFVLDGDITGRAATRGLDMDSTTKGTEVLEVITTSSREFSGRLGHSATRQGRVLDAQEIIKCVRPVSNDETGSKKKTTDASSHCLIGALDNSILMVDFCSSGSQFKIKFHFEQVAKSCVLVEFTALV